MECPRCHNRDNRYLYEYLGEYYCRKCIMFSRVKTNDFHLTKRIKYPYQNVSYSLDFELSSKQLEISHQLLKNYKEKKNSFVWAVCGSGKTEIVFEVIQYALNQGERVCFCIPRKELVKELYQRIQSCFQNIEIGLLYGGYEKRKDAQFIICTMHQLYKFENDIGFDLMISDEVDAFPFYGNDILEKIFSQCCLGTFIKLSATFTQEDIQGGELLVMNKRYHNIDLPIPKKVICPYWLQKWFLLLILLQKRKRWIVYVPTIHLVKEIVGFLNLFIKNVQGVSSQLLNSQIYLQHLRESSQYVLVSTTLLERGITIENVHVIVFNGEHQIFDERTLIQIAGRVGRKPQYPSGDIYFLTSSQTKAIRQCIKTIKRLNQMNV
ncbi:MAG: DEAD/DEAH box helicase family protein [Coprobacillus sp.]|nr:DEAD/DEAH box helicase family protein [Coprobacillus sp.]